MKVYIDLTNLMTVNFLTGIQRVVKEIVVRMLENKTHELVLLAYYPTRNAYQKLDNAAFYACYANGEDCKERIRTPEHLDFTEIPPRSVFFDIDSVWNSRLKRSYLYPLLKQRNVHIITHVYDIIPITHPQYCHENTTVNFMNYIGAVLQYTDLVITSAQATVEALDKLADSVGTERKRCKVVPLGSNFSDKAVFSQKGKPDPEVVKITENRKYLLMLGTLEPRKNHSLVIDALESGLAEQGISAIFAGRIGWNVEALESRIRDHPLYGRSLFFVENPDDSTVDHLYKNAFAVAFPTFNEGFGLPIIEAFHRGTPVVASDIGVLHEVAGAFADYFDPTDKDDLIRCVSNLLHNEAAYAARKQKLTEFVPFTWDQSAAAMEEAISTVAKKSAYTPKTTHIRQMVCLTARNEDILATLPYIEHFMPFIEEIVLCTPEKNVDELKAAYNGRLTLQFLTDPQILNGKALPDDHATRNFFLRCLAMRSPVFDDVFIMTDDDYRPLRTVTESDFIRDGAYLAYYCYDLNAWMGTYGRPTSFDISMRKTLAFLKENNCPTLMYASHQPQVIDKHIFNAMTEQHPEICTQGLCDWSTYFNYGIKHFPELFAPVPYVSMCWPSVRSDWNVYVQPENYLFENHYSHLYGEQNYFHGLHETFQADMAEEDQVRIQRFAGELQKQMEDRAVYRSYCESYWLQFREMPSFAAVYHKENGASLLTPLYVQLRCGGWTRIPFTFDRDILEKAGSRKMLLSYWFSDEAGNNITEPAKYPVDLEQLSFLLPVATPAFRERCVFDLRLVLEDKDTAASASINCNLI